MKKNKLMTQKEESLMEIFWTQEEPLTIAEMEELYGKEKWKQATIFRRVKSTSLVKIAVAMLGYKNRKQTNNNDKEKLIKELESIIEFIRNPDE